MLHYDLNPCGLVILEHVEAIYVLLFTTRFLVMVFFQLLGMELFLCVPSIHFFIWLRAKVSFYYCPFVQIISSQDLMETFLLIATYNLCGNIEFQNSYIQKTKHNVKALHCICHKQQTFPQLIPTRISTSPTNPSVNYKSMGLMLCL